MYLHGIPLRLIDTAGIRETEDYVEQLGVEKSKEKINDADLILLMIDSSTSLTNEDIDILNKVKDKKSIILLNKTDLGQKTKSEDLEQYVNHKYIVPLSIKTLEGIQLLENQIKEMFLAGNINFNDHVYITSLRHKNALEKAIHSVDNVINGIMECMPIDLLAIDITNIYEAIGEITGDSVKEDLIEQIFSQFCLGK
jgi:tRNA modification GTPase